MTDRRTRIGLLAIGIGLAIFSAMIPLLHAHGVIANATHFVAGVLVGAGTAILFGALAIRRFGRSASPCRSREGGGR